jgi:hypothetical protein
LTLEQGGYVVQHLLGDGLAPQGHQGVKQIDAQIPQRFDVARIPQPHVHARHFAARYAHQALQHRLAHFLQPLVAHPGRRRRLVTAEQVVQVVAEMGFVPAHGQGAQRFL